MKANISFGIAKGLNTQAEHHNKCFACDKRVGKNPHVAVTSDGQRVYVGSECFKKLDGYGYQPPLGGPKLYMGRFAADGTLLAIIKE